MRRFPTTPSRKPTSRVMNLVACSEGRHAAAILEILNDAIVNSTALYDYRPRSIETMSAWFQGKADGGFPVIGAVDQSAGLLGFATYGTFRALPASKYTVEHSVYVHRDHRRRGIGSMLMKALIGIAVERQRHVLVGAVDAANVASVALHESLGFSRCGVIRHAGFKFGRWLDLAFYQLVLDAPEHPVDG